MGAPQEGLGRAKVERIYRETKVMSIGGGPVEIMKDLAARQMGL
jgi:acyl-CoA dehydrogenase